MIEIIEALALKTKMLALIVGAVLVIIAVVLGLVQILNVYNIYGVAANKWYFYSCVAISGIAGLFLAAWGLLKKDKKQTAPTVAAK